MSDDPKSAAHAEQLALLKSTVRSRRPKPQEGQAPELPVATVAVDLPLAHLDRFFDYLVPASMHESAVPGCRVKVRFSGRDVTGFLVQRVAESDHVGRLASLRRVVSREPVLTPDVLAVARLVADRYAGTLADVLRLAVPPRHARVEGEDPHSPAVPGDVRRADDPAGDAWGDEVGGAALLKRLAAGESPRAVWTARPGVDWPAQLAAAAAATLRSGRGAVLCVPDARDVARLDEALAQTVGASSYVVLTADLGPAARYRAFLAVARGQVQVVVGTRAAAFAPVHRLGLVAIWDDGDDLFAEPRAPYPHAREVLLLRAHHERAAAIVGGVARSVEAQALVESGWAAAVAPRRETTRAAAPQVHVTGESDRDWEADAAVHAARMPRQVFDVVRQGLRAGPVLVHTPRAGYQPALACASCWQPARCAHCSGPLTRARGGAVPTCRICGATAEQWVCAACGGQRLRAPVVGSLRTAEEWGRGFPRTTVRASGGGHVIEVVDDEPAIVVATPGAEPHAPGGYAAAVIMDTWLTLSRPGLRAAEEAVRRWLTVASLVRPGGDGGRVVMVGDPALLALQAVVRWDPAGFAARELEDRRSAHLTPAARVATITGPLPVVEAVAEGLTLPAGAQVLGPVDAAATAATAEAADAAGTADASDQAARLVVRVPKERGPALSASLQQMQAGRTSRKLPAVRVQVDPTDLV
ncbi:MAG: primosomal protein N' [Nocardioidaceae bacterium]